MNSLQKEEPCNERTFGCNGRIYPKPFWAGVDAFRKMRPPVNKGSFLPALSALQIAAATAEIFIAHVRPEHQAYKKYGRKPSEDPKTTFLSENHARIGGFVDIRIPGLRKPVAIHYFDSGPKDPNKSVLCLSHGFASNAYQFSRLAPRLIENGHRVIIPDWPGHGYSGVFPDDDYSLKDRMAPCLNGFLKALNLKNVSIVSSSMGGYLTQHAAVQDGSRIGKLIFFSSMGSVGEPLPPPWFVRLAAGAALLKGYPLQAIKHLEHLATYLTLSRAVHPEQPQDEPWAFGPHDVEQFARPYYTNEGPAKAFQRRKARQRIATELETLLDGRSWHREQFEFQRAFPFPSVVVHSSWDRAIPPRVGRVLAETFFCSALVWIDSHKIRTAGHTLMSDTPDLAARIVYDVEEGRIRPEKGPDKLAYFYDRSPSGYQVTVTSLSDAKAREDFG